VVRRVDLQDQARQPEPAVYLEVLHPDAPGRRIGLPVEQNLTHVLVPRDGAYVVTAQPYEGSGIAQLRLKGERVRHILEAEGVDVEHDGAVGGARS